MLHSETEISIYTEKYKNDTKHIVQQIINKIPRLYNKECELGVATFRVQVKCMI